jgi:guanine deaminase
MNEHETFILAAIHRANISAENGGYPFGAVIVKEGKIVGESNVDDQAFDPTAHAELSSIRNACKNLQTYDLTGCRIYSSCHPCQLCLGAKQH